MKMSAVPVLAVILFAFQLCTTRPQTNATGNCFTGKLVKRGICGQRVVQLLDQPANGIAIAGTWTDSLSNKHYQNVFTVANSCDFPVSIREGDEFRFSLTTAPPSDCMQCYAYTPVPAEKNNIATGCTQ